MNSDESYDVEYVWTVTVSIRGESAHVHAEHMSSDGVTAECVSTALPHGRSLRLAKSIHGVLQSLYEYSDGGDPF